MTGEVLFQFRLEQGGRDSSTKRIRKKREFEQPGEKRNSKRKGLSGRDTAWGGEHPLYTGGSIEHAEGWERAGSAARRESALV